MSMGIIESGEYNKVAGLGGVSTNTTIIQSDVKRSVTQDPTKSTWYRAALPKPAIPAGKRLVRWLAFTDSNVMAVSVGGYNGGFDNCILVLGEILLKDTTPLTFKIWWGAEVADM